MKQQNKEKDKKSKEKPLIIKGTLDDVLKSFRKEAQRKEQ